MIKTEYLKIRRAIGTAMLLIGTLVYSLSDKNASVHAKIITNGRPIYVSGTACCRYVVVLANGDVVQAFYFRADSTTATSIEFKE